jgi:hypothetical protein
VKGTFLRGVASNVGIDFGIMSISPKESSVAFLGTILPDAKVIKL